jgi:predicted nucleic acid-binding protein
LIIDERKGRTIAQEMGLFTIGILGILVEAKRMGIISLVQPLIEKLKKVDFRMSAALIENILKMAGEWISEE